MPEISEELLNIPISETKSVLENDTYKSSTFDYTSDVNKHNPAKIFGVESKFGFIKVCFVSCR